VNLSSWARFGPVCLKMTPEGLVVYLYLVQGQTRVRMMRVLVCFMVRAIALRPSRPERSRSTSGTIVLKNFSKPAHFVEISSVHVEMRGREGSISSQRISRVPGVYCGRRADFRPGSSRVAARHADPQADRPAHIPRRDKRVHLLECGFSLSKMTVTSPIGW
jgi:hypothetical protein